MTWVNATAWPTYYDVAERRPPRPNPYLRHLDGVPWNEAPRPRRWHRCTPQTLADIGGEQIARCACGAIRHPADVWINRNSRSRVTTRRTAR